LEKWAFSLAIMLTKKGKVEVKEWEKKSGGGNPPPES
jgi:hypothetical protein